MEVFIHRLLLLLVLLPLAFLAFPFMVFHVGASLVNLNLSEDWRHWRGVSASEATLLNDGEEMGLAAGLALLSAYTGVLLYRRRLAATNQSSGSRRYNVPHGEYGKSLTKRVEAFWSKIAADGAAAPEVLWFSNVGVLARALNENNRDYVAVSSGLWEKINSDDSIAEIVLLHELAHLAHRDPNCFKRLSALMEAANRSLATMFRVLMVIVAFLMIHQLVTNIRGHVGAWVAIREETMIAAIGLLALSICPVTAAVIRRYISLITSLIELRADVCSAQWSGGLDRFGEILSDHPMVHKSMLSDRVRSWFSLQLTHLSETERIEILRNPERLLTPKVQYFAFSLLLALLLPFNGLTPLFEGGILDLAAVITVALALMTAISTMLVLAGGTVRISTARLLVLSIALTLFTAASRINVYTITYSLSTVAVSVGLPASASPPSLHNSLADMLFAFHDIGVQLLDIWSHGWMILNILIIVIAFRLLLGASKKLPAGFSSNAWFLTGLATTSGCGILLDGYDRWRTFTISETILGKACEAWLNLGNQFPGVRFTLGPFIALMFVAAFLILAPKNKIKS